MKNISFDYVDLADSWVLGWHYDSTLKRLAFNLEVSLWKGHEKYTKPLRGEFTCYKRGALVFDGVIKINGLLPMSKVRHSIDPDGSIDFGNIEILQQISDDKYKLEGDFGEVFILCKSLHLEIKDK